MDSLLYKLDIPVSLQHPYVRHKVNAPAFADYIKFIVNLARNHPDFIKANTDCVFDCPELKGMPLCLDKCIVLYYGKSNPRHRYQCNNGFLPVATSFRDLGVIRSSDDTYIEHVSNVAQRGQQLIGQCFRAFQGHNPIETQYSSYVSTVPMSCLSLNYGSPI